MNEEDPIITDTKVEESARAILTEWTSKSLIVGDFIFRRVGGTFECQFSLPLNKGMNYMLPNFFAALQESGFQVKMIQQEQAVTWIEKLRGVKVQEHHLQIHCTFEIVGGF